MLLLMLLLLLLLLSLMPPRSPQLPIRCVEPSANMRRSILCCVLLQFSALLTTVCVIQLTILALLAPSLPLLPWLLRCRVLRHR